MLGYWLMYGMILCLSAILAVLYPEYTMALFFVCVLCYPVVAWAELMLHRIFLSAASVEVSEYQVRVKLYNWSLLPVFHMREKYQVRNRMTGEITVRFFFSGMDPLTSVRTKFAAEPEHYGLYELWNSRIRISDAFGLIRIGKKLKQKELFLYSPLSDRKYSMPEENTEEQYADEMLPPELAETASRENRGEEIPETKEIREYQPGDRQNRIHQRLTARYDRMMVRILEAEKHPELLLLPCLEAGRFDENDRCLEYLTDLAEVCLERNITADVQLPAAVTEGAAVSESDAAVLALRQESDLEDILYQILSTSFEADGRGQPEQDEEADRKIQTEDYAMIARISCDGVTWMSRGGEEL